MGLYVDRGYTFEQAQGLALIELDVWYGGAVLDVFDCNVLGAPHRYYCAESDQLRMLNGKVANISMGLMCGLIDPNSDSDPNYQWTEHTSAECGKVHTAYVSFSKDAAGKYSTWKAEINSATTVEQIDTICVNFLR